MIKKQNLLGMKLEQLNEKITELGLPKFTGKQIADWIYRKRVKTIDEMSNISLKNRTILKDNFSIGRSEPIDIQRSTDGTKKMLFKTDDAKYIETVSIPDQNRVTICLSTQVGCRMGCDFCMTGKQGFHGNLTATDILNQLYSAPKSEEITNLVLMGMGEPLDNYENVMIALELLMADYGLALSPRRITLSTIGLKSNLKRFINESECHLAISLHNPLHEERLKLMPIEQSTSVADLIDIVKSYDWSRQRRLSFEYIMFDGINDSLFYARQLTKLLSGIVCRINLIRFHEIPMSKLRPSPDEQMIKFRDFLNTKGFISTIRASRGEDISAACGMLSTAKTEDIG